MKRYLPKPIYRMAAYGWDLLFRRSMKNQYWGRRPLAPPETICVVLNNVCNLRCAMCDIGTGDNGSHLYKEISLAREKSMKIDTLTAIMDSALEINPKPSLFLVLSEPLLYKDFSALVLMAEERQISLYITTNGTLWCF